MRYRLYQWLRCMYSAEGEKPTVFLAPLCEGEPRLDLGHVWDIANERTARRTRGEWGGVLLSQNLLDEVYSDASKTYVEPGNVSESQHGGEERRRCMKELK